MAKTKRREKLEGMALWISRIAIICLFSFHVYTAATHPLTAIHQRSFHLAWIMLLVFLLYPIRNKPEQQTTLKWYDWVIMGLAFFSNIYIFLRADSLALSGGMYNNFDIFVGIIDIILVFEAARRTIGYQLPTLALIFLIYAYIGPYIPEPFTHCGFSTERIVEHLYLTTEGIFSMVLGVSATYIIVFIIFGAFLQLTGVADFFNDFSMALAGGTRGGPAKIAVISSSLMGTVSGSTSANVATTGTFTIPLMKKIGYPPYFAGGIEAAASAGGQIMPPVMGAASFIMADTLGIPYLNIIKAALIPAILYYLGVFMTVDLRAKKLNLKGLPKEELPKLKDVIKTQGYLILPLVVIVYTLLKQYNPLFCAFWGLVTTIVIYIIRVKGRINFVNVYKTIERGILSAVPVAVACTIVGIIIGIASLTGFAFTFGGIVLSLTKSSLFLTLLITMSFSIIMGMGLPTTACYVIVATIAAPILTKMNITPLAAHMFVFYFGILSTITPPVAIGAYTAAGIANSNPTLTAWTAVRIALAGFVIPYIFIVHPQLLLIENLSWSAAFIILQAIIAILALSYASEGVIFTQTTMIERLLLIAVVFLIIHPSTKTSIIGMLLFIAPVAINYILNKRQTIEAAS